MSDAKLKELEEKAIAFDLGRGDATLLIFELLRAKRILKMIARGVPGSDAMDLAGRLVGYAAEQK